MSDESRRSDELVSAYLDGEATPAEVAEVEGDDVLLARVEHLRAVRDAVAAPVQPMSAERRDQAISAALAVVGAEAAERREAKIVPLHRPRQTLLAVAAATIVLAAVVGAGLIASRGSDDSTETAADAPAALDSTADMSQASSADEEPMAEAEADDPSRASPTTTMRMAEADMAMADDSTDDEMAEEEAMAEEGAMAEPESQMEAPAEAAEPTAAPDDGDAADGDAADGDAADGDAADGDAADADAADAERETEEERRAGSTTDATESDADGPAQQVVDLGTLEDLESLFDGVGARRSAAPDDGAMTDPGTCSVAVHEHVLESSTEPLESFIATVGTADPLTIDAQLARRADGTSFIAYAATPACEIDIHELGTLDGP